MYVCFQCNQFKCMHVLILRQYILLRYYFIWGYILHSKMCIQARKHSLVSLINFEEN